MIRIDQPTEAVAAAVMFPAAFAAGLAFEAGSRIVCAALLLVAAVALRGLRELTDQRERRALDNGVRRMSDEARQAIRDTLKDQRAA